MTIAPLAPAAPRYADPQTALDSLLAAQQALGNASNFVEEGAYRQTAEELQLASSSLLKAYGSYRQLVGSTDVLQGVRSEIRHYIPTLQQGHVPQLPDVDFDQDADAIATSVQQLQRAIAAAKQG